MSRKEAQHNWTIMALNNKGDEAFDVQWGGGGEGHTEPAPPPTNFHKLPDID